MKSFRWGRFDDLMEAGGFAARSIECERGSGDVELGRVDISSHGEGMLEYLSSDSLRVIVFDCKFHDEQVFSVVDGEWLRLNFGLSLAVDMTFGDRLQVHAYEPAWRFIRLPDEQASIEVLPPDTRLQWVTVCCRPALLHELTGARYEELARTRGGTGELVHRSFAFTPRLQHAVSDLFVKGLEGRFRLPYLAAKAHELLVLGVDHMMREATAEHAADAGLVRLSDRELRALHALRGFIDANLQQLPTLRALSLRAGMNRTKMFYGFKQLFGRSLSQHVKERRLEEGYRRLLTTDEPVGEIAAEVGFLHQCNFSTAFKTRYGVSPLAVRASRTGAPDPKRGRG